MSFRSQFSGVLGTVSGAKSFQWAHQRELYLVLAYKVSKVIFFWSFFAFPQKLSENDNNDFTVAAVHDLVEEKSVREQ